MAYSPFLIAPFGTGLDQDQEIWQLPQDAFSDIINGHIHHGQVEKRNGYSFYGYMVHDPVFAITAATAANQCAITAVGHTYIDGNKIVITNVNGMTELNQRIFTVDNAGVNTFELLGEDSTNYTAYAGPTGRTALWTGDRIMGIHEYIDATGVRDTLIFDTLRAAIYDGGNNRFNPLDTADIFSGDTTAYILSAGWQSINLNSRLYFTNGLPLAGGLDGIRYYDAVASGTTTVAFTPVAIRTNIELYGAKLMFTLKQRLLCLNTYEHTVSTAQTVHYPQRLRWCAAQNPANWEDTVAGGGGFVDAPTNEQIVSAQSIQDSIIVYFTNSVWIIRPVSDPALPFRWDKLNSFRASDSRTGTIGYDRYVLSLGIRGITMTDGTETQRADTRIHDFVDDEVNIEEIGKVFMKRDFNDERTWILYPQTESSDCNAALIYDEDSKAYTKYLFSRTEASSQVDMNVLGYISSSSDLVAGDFIEANGKDWVAGQAPQDATALSFFMSLDDELFTGGDRNGTVFVMNDSVNDHGNSIEFELDSAGWNPYIAEGSEAQFGYIDLYLSSDLNTVFTIEFFKDDSLNPYKSQTMNLLPNIQPFGNVASITINADPSTGFVVGIPDHGVTVGDVFYLYGLQGANYLNNRQFIANSVTRDTISVSDDITGFGKVITTISQANPGIVTALDHGFEEGQLVNIVDVSGMTEVNGIDYAASGVKLDFFDLQGIDTTGFTAYTSGGYIFPAYTGGGIGTEKKFHRRNIWKRAYAGGIGYVHKIRITEVGSDSSWKILAFRPWFRKRSRRTHG